MLVGVACGCRVALVECLRSRELMLHVDLLGQPVQLPIRLARSLGAARKALSDMSDCRAQRPAPSNSGSALSATN